MHLFLNIENKQLKVFQHMIIEKESERGYSTNNYAVLGIINL